jgi:alkyl hydroperoxide reductase subunit AhpF
MPWTNTNTGLAQRSTDSTSSVCLGSAAASFGTVETSIDPEKIYDVVIVGAGPAGLAASVYAESSVLAMVCRAFGGQAGASARIENYLVPVHKL